MTVPLKSDMVIFIMCHKLRTDLPIIVKLIAVGVYSLLKEALLFLLSTVRGYECHTA